jgi:2',3'-cyclic-nucleotide 2'-phosphodiesterase (5'-nucleotidase family)
MPTIELLHWNDVHARFDALARLSARARQIRTSAEHPVLLLDGGDVEDTSVRLSALTSGVAGWRLLGAAGVDAAVAGNGGLLRYGPDLLPRYADALGSTPLVCDLEDASGGTPKGAAPSAVLDAGPVRVGVIGVTDYYSQYDAFGLSERGRITAVRREAGAVRRAGAQLVVVLSHAGLNNDRALSWSMRGLVDVIVGGHTHHLLPEGDLTEGLPIAQAGWRGEHLGRVQVEVDEHGARVVGMSVERVPDDAAGDPAVLAELEAAEADLAASMAEPLGRLAEPAPLLPDALDNPVARLAVEALLDLHPADLGVLIGGHLDAGLPSGTVTRGDVWAATSSPGNAATATLTGRELRTMFERGRSEEFGTATPRTFRGRPRGYLAAAGAELRDGTLLVGGAPVEDARRYRVTGTDLELSPYGGLVDDAPDDLIVHVPAILPEMVEEFVSRRHPL